MNNPILISANAKLNLSLDITGLRDDGYHLLDSVMYRSQLSDFVTVEPYDSLFLECPSSIPRGTHNIAYRAAVMLAEVAGIEPKARIVLSKRIPNRAGLGGGSANAAAVLKALNKMWGIGYLPNVLRKLGVKLGADVPFMLEGGIARCTGIGENIRSISDIKLSILILKPEQGLSTPEVYKKYDVVGTSSHPNNKRLVSALITKDLDGIVRSMGNVLQDSAILMCKDIEYAINDLLITGAVGAQMTGSGSAVFGLYSDHKIRDEAYDKLYGKWPICVIG